MHLKSLELVGFKSFPVRTILEFGKGMTAIVGPNGCGKSNISDAIRWVLGEQSAKLLRGSKMEDCIFNGTDDRKPLGMAEVNLTLADCEKAIDTEFHEVTVTRRVFRSGEGQYFINKTPCRLKDIQRLFMDTGVGTNSYSLMEQGRVDLILSSRPEDRRVVFEEASGITKYKTDKREALRKLDQTEANLLRLADIIKEVKRQIISLQRQAGKARRAKTLKQELRSLDIFVSRERLLAMDLELQRLEAQMASHKETVEAFQQDIRDLEQTSESFRNALSETERDITAGTQADSDLRSRLERTQQSIVTNQNRIKELRELVQRDSDDAAKAKTDVDKQRQSFEHTQNALKNANTELASSEKHLHDKARILAEHEQAQERTRQSIEDLYADSMDLENRLLKLQNQHHDMEVNDRSIVSQRERTAAEQSNLTRVLEGYEKRLADFSDVLKTLESEAAQADAELSRHLKEHASVSDAIKAADQKRAECLVQVSAKEAQIEFINRSLTKEKAFPPGTTQLLDKSNPLGIDRDRLLGALSEQLDTPAEFRTALEAVLRSWLDAVVVTNMHDALDFLRLLEAHTKGPARLLAADIPCATISAGQGSDNGEPGIPLIDRVSYPDRIRALMHRLLINARVVKSLQEMPIEIPAQSTYVTLQGAVVRGAGVMELYRRDAETNNPLAQKHQLLELKESIARLQADLKRHDAELGELTARLKDCDKAIAKARTRLEEKRHALARKEGEHQSLARQADHMRENLETVTFELQELEKQGSSVDMRSAIITEIGQIRTKTGEIKVTIAKQKLDLQNMEQERKRMIADATEARVQFAQYKQAFEHLTAQHDPLANRISELETLIQDRSSRAVRYQADIERLLKEIADAGDQIPSLQEEIQRNASLLAQIHERRRITQADWKAIDDKLKTNRSSLDERRDQQNELNAKHIEQRMKRQSMVERITSEYRIPADAISLEPEPEWPQGKPDMESLENTIAELRARIEAIGPVYDGAIDEYQQLEERFAFLQHQQDDLVKSKQQLMDMIKKINQTTTDMFTQTFVSINNNFQAMFKQIFGGGSAKLMLADEDDILESGIEIIARPPGKRLQSVSLLSGGERTLTAVALLFAIYLVKPSPFCVLDELDAALDDSNIGRFIKLLQGFLEQSQFLVITHSRQTISAADVLYGITMEEFGVSKVVSMKFSDREATPAELSENTAIKSAHMMQLK